MLSFLAITSRGSLETMLSAVVYDVEHTSLFHDDGTMVILPVVGKCSGQ